MDLIVKKETAEVLNKWEIQHNTLGQVIAICGSMERLRKLLGLDKKGVNRIDKWRKKPKRKPNRVRIPLGYAILMEYLTGIHFELLSPFTEKTNKILRQFMMSAEWPMVKAPSQDSMILKNLLSVCSTGHLSQETLAILDKWKIQHCALNRVLAICGSIEKLSKLLGLDKEGVDRIGKWRNEDIKIPLGYAIVMECLAGVSFELLSPFTERTNKILRKLMMANEWPMLEVFTKDIIVPEKLLSAHPEEHPIVSTDLVLVAGQEKLMACRGRGEAYTLATIVNLETLRLRIKTPKPSDFLISEQVAISTALKPLMDSYQGKRNDLLKPKPENKEDEKDKNIDFFDSERDKVKRIDQELAEIVGLKNKDALHRARRVCEKGIPALVDALNYKKITLTKATEFAALAPNLQHKSIVQHLAAKGESYARTLTFENCNFSHEL